MSERITEKPPLFASYFAFPLLLRQKTLEMEPVSSGRDDLIVSMMSYLKTGLRMSDKMWKETEKMATEMGLFQNGGYMTVKERLKEEGLQEGLQEGLAERTSERTAKRTGRTYLKNAEERIGYFSCFQSDRAF